MSTAADPSSGADARTRQALGCRASTKQPTANGDIACLKAGHVVLRDLGFFSAAACGEIDHPTLADADTGPIFADLPEGSFLPINDVFALHESNPELSAWSG